MKAIRIDNIKVLKIDFLSMRSIFVAVILLITSCEIAIAKQDVRSLDVWKKGVVSITNDIIKAPYNNTGEYFATGFVVDRAKGVIVTNRHAVNISNVNDTYVTFHNGRESRAALLYTDPHHDFSLLYVDPKHFPEDSVDLKLVRRFPNINDAVTIIGNNDNQSFSVQTGLITSIYEVSNYFSDQSFRISLNARGGSSGSPILNSAGEVIALNFAVDSTFSYSMPAAYIMDALERLAENRQNERFDLGAVLGYYSLDKAVRYLSFPEKEVATYLAAFPRSLNKVLIVESTLVNSPAAQMLQASDIIWNVNGKLIGPELYNFQKIIDDSRGGSIKLGIYRLGSFIDLEITPYNPTKYEVTKMLNFSGATFFEVDDLTRYITGTPLGSVFVSNIDKSSPFSNISTINIDGSPYYLLKIEAIDQHKINNLEDMIKIAPELVIKGEFTIFYTNYAGQGGYNKNLYLGRQIEFQDIKISRYETELQILDFDPVKREWVQRKALVGSAKSQ